MALSYFVILETTEKVWVYVIFTCREDGANVQIVGMSATLPNLQLLADWLEADLYKTEFRPVPLSEHIKVNSCIYDNSFNLIRQLQPVVDIQVSHAVLLPFH